MFQVDVSSDAHPQFCNGCYAAVWSHSTAVSKGIPYCHSINIFTWEKQTKSVLYVPCSSDSYIHFVFIHLQNDAFRSANKRAGEE